MFRLTNNSDSRNKFKSEKEDNINQLMNEVGNELGINENTRSINGDSKQFAERLKKEIKKRTLSS